MADGYDPCLRIDETDQLCEIDSARSFLAKADLDAKSLLQTQPGIDVRGKLAPKGDDVVSSLPVKPIGHRGKTVRRVAREGKLLGSRANHLRGKLPRPLFGRQPITEVYRAVVANVAEL